MPAAYSFESELRFNDAVKMLNAWDDWVRKPNLDGRWLIRDNDRLGDYLSHYCFDEGDRSIVKTMCVYFDTRPRQVTIAVYRDPKVKAGKGDVQQVWQAHQTYVLEVLLPSLGARDVKESDFER